jgi:hypothetical protein
MENVKRKEWTEEERKKRREDEERKRKIQLYSWA